MAGASTSPLNWAPGRAGAAARAVGRACRPGAEGLLGEGNASRIARFYADIGAEGAPQRRGGGDACSAVRLPPRLGGDGARRARTADHRCKGGRGGGQGAHAVAPSRSTEHLGRSYRQRHGGRTGPRRHTAHVQILRGRGHLPRYCAVHSERKRARSDHRIVRNINF